MAMEWNPLPDTPAQAVAQGNPPMQPVSGLSAADISAIVAALRQTPAAQTPTLPVNPVTGQPHTNEQPTAPPLTPYQRLDRLESIVFRAFGPPPQ